MIRTIEEVARNHLCTQCGTCAGICPVGAVTMRETPGGLMIPVVDPRRCSHCRLCHKVCPQIQMPAALGGYLTGSAAGPIRRAWLARAADPAVSAAGQTGGLGRSLLVWALESGWADGAVCVVDDPASPLRPTAILTRAPERALRCARSKYCPVPVNARIDAVLDGPGRVAYVGLGCQMQGLHLAMERRPELRKKIAFTVGLFCDRILSFHAMNFLIRCAGLSADRISQFEFRDPTWRGWPGDVRIVDRRNRGHHLSRAYRTGGREFFTPLHCRLCRDKLNVLADVSIGDPYGLMSGRTVSTAVLARTELGLELLRTAQRQGRIELTEADEQQIIRHQNISHRMVWAQLCGRQLRRAGYALPSHLADIAQPISSAGLRPWRAWLAVRAGLFFTTAAGTRILRLLPTWAPQVINLLQRGTARWSGRPRPRSVFES